jgi:hypothetical protein
MVNDGILDSQSNSAEYYQVSYVKNRNEFSQKNFKLYQIHSSEKTASLILFACLKLQDVYTLQTRVLLKLRIALYQNISILKAQHTFLSKIITSVITIPIYT